MSGRLNLWKVSSGGGWPIELVQSDERQWGATRSPDGKWIVFQQDSGGNELRDILGTPSRSAISEVMLLRRLAVELTMSQTLCGALRMQTGSGGIRVGSTFL